MDTTHVEINFDLIGVCNHCRSFEQQVAPAADSTQPLESRLLQLVDTIKAAGRNKEYDCVIGVSGGVDSTYTAYLVKQLGLRPLAIHLDNGWKPEQAVRNIERAVRTCTINLNHEVPEWDEFRCFQP